MNPATTDSVKPSFGSPSIVPPAQKDTILQEIWEMGGCCDCEVLLNCYEEYETE